MQVRQVVLNPAEFGPQSESNLVLRLARDRRYANAFGRLFPAAPRPISLATISRAIAAYERTLAPGKSPFDQYFYEGEKDAISAAATRGFELFRGRAHCASCHKIGDRASPLSDGLFHVSPVRLSAAADRDLAEITRTLAAARATKLKVTGLISTDPEIASLGRFVVTLQPADIGRFKTPSLRNVAVTGPYMHDGSVGSLRDAVELELYSRKNGQLRPIVLSDAQIEDMIEFLRSLTSPFEASTVSARPNPPPPATAKRRRLPKTLVKRTICCGQMPAMPQPISALPERSNR